MHFFRQVDIRKKRLFPARIKLPNNKTLQPQDNGWLWLGACDALCLPFLLRCQPSCWTAHHQTLQNPEEPTCILIQLYSVTILTVSLQLLWSSILKCFLDVCKSRMHNLYHIPSQCSNWLFNCSCCDWGQHKFFELYSVSWCSK